MSSLCRGVTGDKALAEICEFFYIVFSCEYIQEKLFSQEMSNSDVIHGRIQEIQKCL